MSGRDLAQRVRRDINVLFNLGKGSASKVSDDVTGKPKVFPCRAVWRNHISQTKYERSEY